MSMNVDSRIISALNYRSIRVKRSGLPFVARISTNSLQIQQGPGINSQTLPVFFLRYGLLNKCLTGGDVPTSNVVT